MAEHKSALGHLAVASPRLRWVPALTLYRDGACGNLHSCGNEKKARIPAPLVLVGPSTYLTLTPSSLL